MEALETAKQRITELEQQLYELKESFRQATEPLKQELSVQRRRLCDLKLLQKRDKVRLALIQRQQKLTARQHKAEAARTTELHNTVVFRAAHGIPVKYIAADEGISIERVQDILHNEELYQIVKNVIASHDRNIPDEVILKAYNITQPELNDILGRSDRSIN